MRLVFHTLLAWAGLVSEEQTNSLGLATDLSFMQRGVRGWPGWRVKRERIWVA